MNLDRIELLKMNGFNPARILDIGCHIGNFAKGVKEIWPNADMCLIDANPYLEQELQKLGFRTKICLLGYENKKNVPFFLTKKWRLSSGNSIYPENSPDYSDEYLETIKLDMHRLDDLFPDDTFDFIKMDTQGSEVGIIMGGKALMDRATYVMIECSVMEYNKGGALIGDVFEIMTELGFHMVDIADLFYKENDLCQLDIIFKRA